MSEPHKCVKEREWGGVIAYLEDYKGMKTLTYTIALAAISQIVVAIWWSSSINTTVAYHNKIIEKHEGELSDFAKTFAGVKIVEVVYAKESEVLK